MRAPSAYTDGGQDHLVRGGCTSGRLGIAEDGHSGGNSQSGFLGPVKKLAAVVAGHGKRSPGPHRNGGQTLLGSIFDCRNVPCQLFLRQSSQVFGVSAAGGPQVHRETLPPRTIWPMIRWLNARGFRDEGSPAETLARRPVGNGVLAEIAPAWCAARTEIVAALRA
jgi:hypothetical protein